jgi:hypothetical protein
MEMASPSAQGWFKKSSSEDLLGLRRGKRMETKKRN